MLAGRLLGQTLSHLVIFERQRYWLKSESFQFSEILSVMLSLGLGLSLGLRPENAGLGLGLGLETSGPWPWP